MTFKIKRFLWDPHIWVHISIPVTSVCFLESIAQPSISDMGFFFLQHTIFFLINIGIADLLWLGLISLTRKKITPVIILFIFQAILGFVSRIKVEFRNSGPLLSDFTHLSEAFQMRSALPPGILISVLISGAVISSYLLIVFPYIHLPPLYIYPPGI